MHASSPQVAHLSARRPVIRPLLREVLFDGTDFAIRLNFSRSWHKAVEQAVSTPNGLHLRWGWYQVPGTPRELWGHWRVHADLLEASLPALYQQLVESGLEEGILPTETLEDLSAALAAAREARKPALYTAGVRIELYQLESFAAFVRCTYHSGIKFFFRHTLNGLYESEMGGWWVPSISTERLSQLLREELHFAEEQVTVKPGVYRVDSEDMALVELSPDERQDWERQLAARAGIFDGIDATRDFEILEEQQLVPVDEEGAAKAQNEPRRYFLDITEQLRATDYSSDVLETFLAQAAPRLRENMPNFQDYLDVQLEGIKFLVARTSRLLADDMGLGKTLQATMAAGFRAKQAAKKVLVVTTKSAIYTAWRKTILAAFPDDTVSVNNWHEAADWVICNFEQLESVVEHAKDFGCIVIDEAHKVTNPTAARTRQAFALAAAIQNRYLLTGTPVLNQPDELHTLLRLSGHPLGSIPVRDYRRLMAEDDFKDSTHTCLNAEWLLRRLKIDYLDLPPKHRHTYLLKMKRAQRRDYDLALDDGATAMDRMHAVRRVLGDMKVDWIVSQVKKLKKKEKVIIFCVYESHVEAIRDRLTAAGRRCVTIFGKTKDVERQKAQNAFQEDPDVNVFIGTIGAAGESITLTAAKHVYFSVLPWTYGALSQAEDRAWRNGVQHEVHIHIPLMEDSIDERLMELIARKEQLANDLFNPNMDATTADLEALMMRAHDIKGGDQPTC